MEKLTSDDHPSNEDEPNMKDNKRASEEAHEDHSNHQLAAADNRSINDISPKKRGRPSTTLEPEHGNQVQPKKKRGLPKTPTSEHEDQMSQDHTYIHSDNESSPRKKRAPSKSKMPARENQDSPPQNARMHHSERTSSQNDNPYFLKTSSHSENPYQDSTDSELDEIESDIELEMALQQELDRKQKPHLKLAQEGYVCNYCGVLIPYEQWKPSYPQVYVCQDCKDSLDEPKTSPSALRVYRNKLQRATEALRLDDSRSPTYPSAKGDRISEEDPFRQAQEESSNDMLVAGGMVWTAEEGNMFFHGLRRFGKHNIWAIKEHVKTRTLAEIVTMIQLMEAELGRRRNDGMEAITLKNMPMATEATEAEIQIEESLAHKLLQEENKERWTEISKEPDETRSTFVEKSRLFNLRTLSDLSSRLYIQNESAGIEREVVYELHDALVAWLKPLIKELAMMNHEQNRIGEVLNQVRSQPLLPPRSIVRHRRKIYGALIFIPFFRGKHRL